MISKFITLTSEDEACEAAMEDFISEADWKLEASLAFWDDESWKRGKF